MCHYALPVQNYRNSPLALHSAGFFLPPLGLPFLPGPFVEGCPPFKAPSAAASRSGIGDRAGVGGRAGHHGGRRREHDGEHPHVCDLPAGYLVDHPHPLHHLQALRQRTRRRGAARRSRRRRGAACSWGVASAPTAGTHPGGTPHVAQVVKIWKDGKTKKGGLLQALRRVCTPKLVAAWVGLGLVYW